MLTRLCEDELCVAPPAQPSTFSAGSLPDGPSPGAFRGGRTGAHERERAAYCPRISYDKFRSRGVCSPS